MGLTSPHLLLLRTDEGLLSFFRYLLGELPGQLV
jgi:hypothetical protein